MGLFKNLTLKLNTLICNAKRAFYEAKISVCKTSKSLYGLVSNFYDSKKTSILPTNVPFKDLPNIFNDFFFSKITKIRSCFAADSCQSFCDTSFTGDFFIDFKLLFKNLTLKLNNLICNTKRAFYEAKISVCKTSKSLYELE